GPVKLPIAVFAAAKVHESPITGNAGSERVSQEFCWLVRAGQRYSVNAPSNGLRANRSQDRGGISQPRDIDRIGIGKGREISTIAAVSVRKPRLFLSGASRNEGDLRPVRRLMSLPVFIGSGDDDFGPGR